MLDIKYTGYLTDRQTAVLNHYIGLMNFDKNKMTFLKLKEYATDLFPIDIAIFEPTKDFKYYTITTVGLSQYRFPKFFPRVELCMTLPKSWKLKEDDENYMWVLNFIQDIAFQIVQLNYGVQIGQVYLFKDDNNTGYSKHTDTIGGIICLPEMYPLEMFEEYIENTYTRFLQVMTITEDDVKKIDEMGPQKYIKFELHDSDKPLMVVPIREKKVEGIDKLIRKNEDSLKGN